MNPNRSCEWCKKGFVAQNSRGRFCSAKCRAASHRAGPKAKTPAERPSIGSESDGDTLSAVVADLRSEIASEGLLDTLMSAKLHRMASMAVLLDENPNQPSLLAQFRALEGDVERSMPTKVDDEYQKLLAELQASAEDFANAEFADEEAEK